MNQGFPYFFCLMIQGAGAGAGSILLTKGSGSGRPKNKWIRIRIQIRIRIGNIEINKHIVHSVADPGCLSRIPDPTFFHPGSELFPSRIRIKEFKYFNPKKWFLSSILVVHPGSGS
jgi:hypothetical protein